MLIYHMNQVAGISIHAPREGGDRLEQFRALRHHVDFNPRPPRGGRLLFLKGSLDVFLISIHAPREGGDQARRQLALV